MDTRIFIGELLQDLPLWVALFMSVYVEYQNENIFFGSLIIGIAATFYLLYEIKKGRYSFETLFNKPSEATPFIIYSFLLLIILIILTFQDRLYMGSIVWMYVIAGSLGEMLLMRKDNKIEK
ncbi:hypothetical protein [Persephonella sp.]